MVPIDWFWDDDGPDRDAIERDHEERVWQGNAAPDPAPWAAEATEQEAAEETEYAQIMAENEPED